MNIQQAIDKYLEKENEKERTPSGKISPSSLGRCFRYQYWKRLNEPVSDPLESRVLRVFAVGKLFHKFVQDIVGGQVEVLIETEDEKGYADIVEANEVTDLKSVNSRKFSYLDKLTKEQVIKEEYNNFLQGAWYGIRLNKPRFRLCFLSKDDFRTFEILEETKNWVVKVEQELDTLRGYWNSKTLPPAQPRCFNGKECQFCGFRTKCKELENGNQ